MRWGKRGLIYGPDGSSSWAKYSALQPTPHLLNDDIIRVFLGFRDDQGIGRVGFVDVESNDPSKICRVSRDPVLDIGIPGTFDDNGVIPCAVVKRDEGLFLYYAGYQISNKVKFLAYGGLAVSDDNGESFKRLKKTPILERTNDELYFRVIHSIIFDNGIWKTWYGAGSDFLKKNGKAFPVYNIRYMESKNSIDFPEKGTIVIDIKEDEHRVGRPNVVKIGKLFIMFYGVGTIDVPYRLAYAISSDGITWDIKGDISGLSLSQDGWDSKMMAYPAVITTQNGTYMFYNGNNMGRDGFGYAKLIEW